MRRHQKFPVLHEPVRRWRHPLGRVCACGIGGWPCPVKTMLDRQVQQAVDELADLRDELYLAGYDVPMPVEPDHEERIGRLLADHWAAVAAEDRQRPAWLWNAGRR
jgi:hypothetical protein